MYIDLTCKIEKDNPVLLWAGQQAQKHIATGHVGTHIDVYEKTTIPLEYVQSRGICFDVRDIQEINVADIDLSKVEAGDFVIFYTGQTEKYVYGSKEYFANHPCLSQELIDNLISKKVHFIGIDTAGIRQGTEHEPADRKCEKHGIYVVENLCNLKDLPNKELQILCLWFEDKEMTGIRTRIIAKITKS